MELIIRAAVTYAFILVILRVSGKRQFSQISTFDFVLLLIVSEAIAQGMIGGADYSLTAAVILVSTLVAIDIALSFVKRWLRPLDDVLEGVPVLLLENGQPISANLSAERVDEGDILEAARGSFGIERLEQIRYAVLEKNGSISIIPER